MKSLILLLGVMATILSSTSALYGSTSDVQVVDPAGLKKLMQTPTLLMVEFFAPWCGHCRNLVPEMDKLAKALKGVVHIVAVDADEHKGLAQQYQVQGFPTIMIFGDDRSKPVPYNGGRTAKEMVSHLLREVQKLADGRLGNKKKSSSGGGKSGSSATFDLTDSNFEKLVLESSELWMVEFYAPWCGHCKNLAPEWDQAAKDLKGSVNLGMVDATQHQSLASKYGVQGYPTIKVFGANKAAPEDYQGQRSAQAIVDYGLAKIDELGIDPEVNEVVDPEVLKSECLEKKKICVVAILPHVMDTGASGRNKYIESMVEVAKKMRSRSMAFMWMSGGSFSSFEDVFHVSYNYPTFIAISHKKERFASHKGAFNTAGIVNSLKRIESGKQSTSPIKGDYLAFKKTDPWDGKDYQSSEE